MSSRLKITAAGQVSIPADVRRRWDSTYVSAEDHGDYLILRPAPDDPVDAVYGIFAEEARGKAPLERIREEERAGDAAGDAAKWPD